MGDPKYIGNIRIGKPFPQKLEDLQLTWCKKRAGCPICNPGFYLGRCHSFSLVS